MSNSKDVRKKKEIDRARNEFISLASHQLRTPLTAIKWFLELLLAEDVGPLTEDQKKYLKSIDQSNERMIHLVNSLLHVSRIEAGKIGIHPTHMNIQSIVWEVLADLEDLIKQKEISIAFSCEDIPDSLLDPRMIKIVYKNLISNAVKYSPNKTKVTISLFKKDNTILSQISDEGYGIPQHEYEKLFTKFYRGENIVTLDTDGNGLGLFLAKAIVESSHGSIWFESIEGKGTTFWFSLPIKNTSLI